MREPWLAILIMSKREGNALMVFRLPDLRCLNRERNSYLVGKSGITQDVERIPSL
jgi:hypothetical protein